MTESFYVDADVTGASQNFDATGVSLGDAFTFGVAGQVTHIRFRSTSTLSGGTYTGALYQIGANDPPGSPPSPLGSATFGALTGNAWEVVALSPAITVSANTPYRPAVFTSVGRYVSKASVHASSVTRGNITALATGATAGGFTVRNGTYKYNASLAFPSDDGTGSSYFVDVVFVPNATVTKDVTESYRVLNAVTKDVTERYRVTNAVTKDTAEVYRVLNAATKNVVEAYRVLNSITKDTAEAYRVLNAGTKDVTDVYRVLNAGTVDKVEQYRVVNALTKDVNEQYRVLNAGTKDVTDAWRVFNALTKDVTETYTVLGAGTVVKDVTETFRVYNAVTTDVVERYRVFAAVVTTVDERYRVLNAQQLDRTDSWRVLNAVVKDVIERYRVLSDTTPPPLSADVTASLELVIAANLNAAAVVARL